MSQPPLDLTGLLLRWNSGEESALDDLTPQVYEELHKLARIAMSRERAGHTLQATALVNEAYLKLIDQSRVEWRNRAHFFGAAARIMRRVLVDHSRQRSASKRGGPGSKVPVDLDTVFVDADCGAVEVDLALARLEAVDRRKAQVVEMKFFGGMTNAEIATVLETSDATVERDWKFARAWLMRLMKSEGWTA
jgi:RNA polymerase sigma-70 factor (ECF subfamily)